MVKKNFVFIKDIPWFKIYKDPKNNEFWRLNSPDKYQVDYMVKIPNNIEFEKFDSSQLEIELLGQTRGESENICIWKDCKQKALNNLVYCASHAYNKMNIKK